MKMVKFHKVIRVGQAKATIYKTPSCGSEAFTAVWYEGTTRKCAVFNELHLAETHAITKATSQANGELDLLYLSGEERLACRLTPAARLPVPPAFSLFTTGRIAQKPGRIV